MFVDIHCHLDHPDFEELDSVVKRAEKAGVGIMVSQGIDKNTNRIVLEMSKKYSSVKAALGIYPPSALKAEVEHIENPRPVEEFDIDEEIDFIRKNNFPGKRKPFN